MDCEIWSELITKSLIYPPCFKGTLIVRNHPYCPWSLLASQGYVLYSAALLWHFKIVMQEALQKFGCQSPFVSVIQPVDSFCAAHSSVSQFWTLTWHSWGCKEWDWDFSTSSIYFRLNTWSFPWKVDIDKLMSGRVREQLALNSRMCCGKFLLSNANSHCKQASHTVKCY